MKIGILGTGEVGNLLGSRLIENGHQVMMGGRDDNNQKRLDFVKRHSSENASYISWQVETRNPRRPPNRETESQPFCVCVSDGF